MNLIMTMTPIPQSRSLFLKLPVPTKEVEQRKTVSRKNDKALSLLMTCSNMRLRPYLTKCKNWRTVYNMRASLSKKMVSTEKRSKDALDLKKSTKWLLRRTKSSTVNLINLNNFIVGVCYVPNSLKNIKMKRKWDRLRKSRSGLNRSNKAFGSETQRKRCLTWVFFLLRLKKARNVAKRR